MKYLWTAIVLLTVSGGATAQADEADRCVQLMQAGDMPGFQACIEAMQKTILGADPSTAGFLQQLEQAERDETQRRNDQQAVRDAARRSVEQRAQANQCIDDKSVAGEPANGQRDYSFAYHNTCAHAVHMRFCIVDGPNQASQRRRFTVAPGGAEQFVLRLGQVSPLIVVDHCLQPGACSEAGPMNCEEAG